MVMRSAGEEREYVLQEAARTARRIRVWPGMRLNVPIYQDMSLDDVLNEPLDDGAFYEEPSIVRIASVELVDLDDMKTWVVHIPPPAPPVGLKRALAQAPGAGEW